MTEIRLENVGNRYVLDINGHANFDSYGKDIVCAGVSTLVQAFIIYCERIEDLDRCSILDETIESGRVRFVVEGEMTYIGPAFEMMQIGLKSIAENYKKYVVVRGEK